MNDVYVSTDLHLYSKDYDTSHPFKTNHQLGRLSDQFATGITENDLWIYLGDLCDPAAADVPKLTSVIKSVPCRKILCKGNHDTADDEWYLELGFDEVCDIVRTHNILFSHKPIRVNPDEINIHGHLHTEKMSSTGYQHINAYAANWNEDDRPVLLDDLLASARIQDLDITERELQHIQDKFQKYTSLENGDRYDKILDLTDEFKVEELAPVHESAEIPEPINEVKATPTVRLDDIVAFNDHLDKETEYGLIVNGQRRPDLMDDFDKNYISLTPQQFQKYRAGVCWDYVAYEAWYLKKNFPSVLFHTWYVQFNHVNPEPGEMDDCPSHTFLTFQLDGVWYYFECSFRMFAGVYVAKSEDDIICHVMKLMADHPDDALAGSNYLDRKKWTYVVINYDALNRNLYQASCMDYMNWIFKNGKVYRGFRFNPNYTVPLRIESYNETSMIDKFQPDLDAEGNTRYPDPFKKEPGDENSDEISLNENIIINRTDIVLNLDTWKPGPNNVLYVTGLSGSGKSTLAEEYEKKYKAIMIELDGVEHGYDSSGSARMLEKAMIKVPAYCDIFTAINNGKKVTDVWNQDNRKVMWAMWDTLIDLAEKDTTRLYVIEGIQIFDGGYDHAKFKDKPLIIKGTSALVSTIRAMNRDQVDPLAIIDQLKNRLKTSKQLDRFSRSVRNEDAVMDEVIFPDTESTRLWMTDDRKNKRKMEQAEDKWTEDADVAIEETAIPPVKAVATNSENPNDKVSTKAVDVAFYDTKGNHIGMAAVSAVDTDDGFLYNVEVFPKYRGKHYGDAIMSHMISNYKIAQLSVGKANIPAINLYKKHGFNVQGEFDYKGEKMLDMTLNEAASEKVSGTNAKKEDGTLDTRIQSGRDNKGKFTKQTIRKGEKITSMQRDEKRDVAHKYGLHAPGQEHENEDEEDAYLKEMEKLHRREKRLKALKKGRNKQKRDAFIKKVKSHLPGVKNEEAEVDTSATEWLEIPDLEAGLFDGEPKKSINEPSWKLNPLSESYRFEMVDKIQFFDRLDEKAMTDTKLYPVYVVVMHTGSVVANAIKAATHDTYSHVSIAFDSALTKMYSFGNKRGKNPFEGGFKHEDLNTKFFQERTIPFAVYVVPSTKEQLNRMKKRLDYFIEHASKFTFDFGGLIKNFFGVAANPEYTWFCSRFVADILNAGTPKKKLVDEPSLIRPQDFTHVPFASFVMEGPDLKNRDVKKIERETKRILNERKAIRSVTESTMFYPENPWGTDILLYQMSKMDENAVDNFMQYLNSFKLRFDKDGNILVTRREYDRLGVHFRESLKMIKACEKSGNVEGVKEELYKIHYMISLINQYYLNPDSRSLRPGTKDVRKDMLDLRSVMMNAFQHHLKYVTTRDPKWNFQSGYNSSKYGKDTFIPQKIITTIGRTVVTALS